MRVHQTSGLVQLLTSYVYCSGGLVQDVVDVLHPGAGLLLQLQQHSEEPAGSHHLPLCGAPL